MCFHIPSDDPVTKTVGSSVGMVNVGESKHNQNQNCMLVFQCVNMMIGTLVRQN